MKKRTKRLLTVIVSLVLIIGAMSISALAADKVASGTCGENLTWVLDDEGTLTISGTGGMLNYSTSTVPWSREDIRNVVIKNGVTEIGRYAFYNFDNLVSVTIPDSLIVIGQSAFERCDSLTKIILPRNVSSIIDGAFADCKNLTLISIFNPYCEIDITRNGPGDKRYTIGVPGTTVVHGDAKSTAKTYAEEYGFEYSSHEYENGVCTTCGINSVMSGSIEGTTGGCTGTSSVIEWSLDTVTGEFYISGTGSFSSIPWEDYNYIIKNVNIGDGITSLPNAAFYNCSNLLSVNIGDGLEKIGDSCFRLCNKLKNVELPETLEEIGKYAFGSCKALTKIDLPEGLEWIWSYAFENCTALESVVLPDGVAISSKAFCNCTGLKEITIGPYEDTYISDDAFTGVTATVFYPAENLTWTEERRGNYGGTLTWQPYEMEAVSGTLENGITWTVDNGTLTINGTGDMPDFYTENGEGYSEESAPWYKYSQCINNAVISDGITSLGDCAFYEHYCLASITLPEGITSIGDDAFWCCENLTSIEIPDSVTSIGDSAFWACNSLTSITIPGSVTSIGDCVFEHCENLSDVKIQNGVTVIGEAAFMYCSELTSITIPNSVTSIEDSAFMHSGLNSISIPDSVTSIGPGAFAYSGLTSVTIPGSVTKIGNSAFAWSSLNSVIILDGVESIGDTAFNCCYNLRSVTIPVSVTSIGDYALTGGYEWADRPSDPAPDIYYGGTKEQWAEISIGEISYNNIYFTDVQNGDVNGDGETSNADLVMIARYIVGADQTESVAQNGDLNSDGQITNADLIMIARVIVGLE